MTSALQKGRLKVWKDDRGFGFIEPADGGKQVFIHISALKGASRRPKVGDTIIYQLHTEPNGKVRAEQASIHSVINKTRSSHPSRSSRSQNPKVRLLKLAIGSLIVVAIPLLIHQFAPRRSPSLITTVTQPECQIKGNISINSGRKLYHVPGMEDYESTVIDSTKGEKWFCTEEEAIAQGWTRAPR